MIVNTLVIDALYAHMDKIEKQIAFEKTFKGKEEYIMLLMMKSNVIAEVIEDLTN